MRESCFFYNEGTLLPCRNNKARGIFMISTRILQQLQPPQSGERVEISEKLNLFSLRFFQCEISKENMEFIKELHQFSVKEFQFNYSDSARYAFRAGYSAIEIDIEVHNQIYITPSICYIVEEVANDLESLIYMDRWVYALLKKHGLQI